MKVIAWINREKVVTIICPDCKKSKIINISNNNLPNNSDKAKCKCICGHSFTAILKENLYKKKIDLPGKFISGNQQTRGLLTIIDISNQDLLIKLNVKHKFIPGDKLLLEFNLDDKFNSLVKKAVTIRAINGIYVNAKFCSIEHYDRLGPYLLFNGLHTYPAQ